ncbi:hypothetical protein CsSME_00050708 [Camellia sinensis var. sinensis]
MCFYVFNKIHFTQKKYTNSSSVEKESRETSSVEIGNGSHRWLVEDERLSDRINNCLLRSWNNQFCVGVYKNGHVEIIENDHGNRITLSWVGFTNSERLIGEAAKNQAAVNAERAIFDVKRLIGRKFEDKEVQRDMKLVPYKIVNKDGKLCIEVKIKDGEPKVFSPEEVSAMILIKMETAEAFLRKKIKDAVVTVPGG